MKKNRDFNSIEGLVMYALSDVATVLKVDAVEEIKDIEERKIQENVYDVYEGEYERRYKNGGLGDRDNIKGEVSIIGNEVLLNVTNDTLVSEFSYDSPQGTYLDEIIEYGTGVKTPYGEPRPFIQPTIEEIEERNIIENILKSRLDYIE